jgi:hypothetical protein
MLTFRQLPCLRDYLHMTDFRILRSELTHPLLSQGGREEEEEEETRKVTGRPHIRMSTNPRTGCNC